MDFATMMVIALAVCGVIWAIDHWLWAPKRRAALAAATTAAGGTLPQEQQQRISKEPLMVEYARSFFPVILVVLLLRSFLVEPFRIPSGSMIPTLWVGDFILVNKYAYGIRLPVVNKKIIDVGAPQRGDVVVFRFPAEPSTDYIKRIVGLPGDRIEYRNKTIFINGEAVPQTMMGPYTEVSTGIPLPAKLQMEAINGVQHEMVIHPDYFGRLDGGDWRVPEGSYFVMGDNRDNSNDSRAWGFVPERNLVGKAFMIWMNWSSGGVTWNRIGDSIH